MHSEIARVTQAIEARSQRSRGQYLDMIAAMAENPVDRRQLSCGNLAHGFAACSSDDKSVIKMMDAANIGIVTAYNDMLSAHQPYLPYPDLIKAAVREVGSTAQWPVACPPCATA
jgi:Dihydroxyacid dehydratase/phosphogluconate dehydratase